MTKQHRATTEQWAQQALWVETYEDSSCIMELLHRIEALEACNKEDANCWSAVRASMHALRARIEALEATQQRPPHQDKLDRLIALDAADDGEPIVLPSSPAGSLVGRVVDVLGHHGDGTARAAILEVAAWLVEQAPEPGPVGKWLGQISTPFAVMADMLRDEANQ